jgi:hypothetical protein
MPTSTAISAQNTKLEVNTSTAGAKTLTAITQANPGVFTSTAHGLVKGDVVTLAGIVGMTQANGLTGVVQYVTANTFILAGLDTTGFSAYTSGGTATPVAYTQVANCKSFTAFDGAATVLDASNLQSTAKEKRMGLQDEGNFAVELDLDTTDAGQIALLAARTAQAQKTFRMTLPNAATATFSGYVTKVNAAGGVDALLKRSVEIAITGPVTWA